MSYHNDYRNKVWTNDSEGVVRHSDYFDAEITADDWTEALELYHDWCIDNNQEPEVDKETELDFVSDEELNHVIYHATMNGFEV